MSGGWEPAALRAPEHRKGDLRFTPPAGPVAEGDTGTDTVRLSRKPTAEVTVTLTQPTNTDVTVDYGPKHRRQPGHVDLHALELASTADPARSATRLPPGPAITGPLRSSRCFLLRTPVGLLSESGVLLQ